MGVIEEEARLRARGQHRLSDPGLDVLDLAGENVDDGIHERQLIAQLRGVLLDELERQTGRRNAFDSLLQASHLLERFLRPFAASMRRMGLERNRVDGAGRSVLG